MKPPVCCLCDRDFEKGALVKFANYVPLPERLVGHPKGMEWFCEQHLEAAQALSHLPFEEAIAKLKQTDSRP